jgi:hypothetical protein
MPRTVLVLLAASVLSVVLEGAGALPASAGEHWRRPLPGGAVAGAFSYERSAPYVRGRRRGVDLAGRPGARVLATCSGVVTHAGRVPGFGRGVTIRCGRLVATELGLLTATVAGGARVLAGRPVGVLSARGVLRLGARVATDRHGYLDPLALIDDAAPTIAPPATLARSRHKPSPATPIAPLAQPARAPLPWPVLPGLALLTLGVVGGGALRVRRRRRLVTAPAQS